LEFLEFVLNDFGITPAARTKSSMLIELNRWLIERYRRNETAVIVVDEAQNLSSELLEEIRLLTNLETSTDKLLQIILSGQPELEEKLKMPELRQLRQRVSLWCRTEPISLEQVFYYISTRLRIAGAEETIFSPGAMVSIHRASRGIPRTINLICEHCLIHAYADRVHQVNETIVSAVAADLDLQSQPFPVSFAQGRFPVDNPNLAAKADAASFDQMPTGQGKGQRS
jgi:general secretion pathway protein A